MDWKWEFCEKYPGFPTNSSNELKYISRWSIVDLKDFVYALELDHIRPVRMSDDERTRVREQMIPADSFDPHDEYRRDSDVSDRFLGGGHPSPAAPNALHVTDAETVVIGRRKLQRRL